MSYVSWASLFISVSLVRVCLCLSLSSLVRIKCLRARESLSDVSWASPLYQLLLSVVYVCLYPKISWTLFLLYTVSKALLSLCLILSLIIVYLFSNLFYNAKMSYLLSTPSASFYYVMSTRARQRLIFWVFVAREFVTDNGIIL